MKLLTGLILFVCLAMASCKKDSFITSRDAVVFASADTLHFDTVFTTTGSVTQVFRIYNNNNQKLRLSRVQLAGGTSSFFKMNVDGTAGTNVQDIEMEANDSLYVFVTVKIDPTAADLPFVIQDSIRIDYNGNEQKVYLEAWGQNAHFIRSRLVTGQETWVNDKPYVILGGVLVDTNARLTIEKGCRIYLHADAPVIVDGTLQVQGERYDSTRVVFRGDRLDNPYRDYPAGWPGIYFRGSSKDNDLQFAVIKNAYQGIVADQPGVNSNAKVTLRECIIDNCYDAGIMGIRSSITAQNCLISNCGKNLVLGYGGNYTFTHCTAAAYSNNFIVHKEPVLLLTNFVKQNNTVLTASLTASFTNCIFWADNSLTDDEVVIGKEGSTTFAVNFQNCLWKVKNNPANVTTANMIVNQSPLFDSINTQKNIYSFRLAENSPALNKGVVTALTTDLDGNARSNGLPDMGCYEKQ